MREDDSKEDLNFDLHIPVNHKTQPSEPVYTEPGKVCAADMARHKYEFLVDIEINYET